MQGIVQGRRALDLEDLSIEQEVHKGLGYRMHIGRIKQSARVVSVKVYRGRHAKKRCSDTAKFLIDRGAMHPNIPHLIAVSGLKSKTPFLVFDGEYEDTVDSMLSWVLKKETKEILTLGLQTVIGLSSGLDYLQELNYPFASVGLDHFVVLSSKGKIVISFDPEELEPASEPDQESDSEPDQEPASEPDQEANHHIALDLFHGLCRKTFNDACKAHYKGRHRQRTYHDKFDDAVPDNQFGEFNDDSSSLTTPASLSATTSKLSPRSLRCPSGRRQELVWRSLTTDTVALNDISRQFQSFLNFHRSSSESALSQRRGRYTARTSHRCPGYSRIEVTLTTDILRSAIVSYSSPTPGEICPVCREVVTEKEIFSCLCGNLGDETMPTVRCSGCCEWHHRSCVDYFDMEKFVCGRCNMREVEQQEQQDQQQQQLQNSYINHSSPSDIFASAAEALCHPSAQPTNIQQPPTGQPSQPMQPPIMNTEIFAVDLKRAEIPNRIYGMRHQIAQCEALRKSLREQLIAARGTRMVPQILAKLRDSGKELERRQDYLAKLLDAYSENGQPDSVLELFWCRHCQKVEKR
ncbi:hypothetical protein GALMADRAFT_242885 [Galerina marginata CBS 339.88]|uniref:Protein kinase domain-containing protein n=1 Tax=Galerina marginata (strain CBS 339.88) TaxID=685588 RepID=A0A067TDQ6_GALM3|nr:hypothetical protein GALMADRAFT_242885 [Galerina marginata CBS 339.88]